ncbi:MAG: AsmA family protein [Pseudomonadota bacterium]
MRWAVRIIAVLIIFIGVALGALLLIPSDRIAGLVADQISEATGREVRLLGEVRPSLWPEIGASTGPVEVLGSDGEVLLRAGSVAVGVDVLGLISGDIRITGAEVALAELTLKRAGDGAANWATPGPAVPNGSAGGVPEFTLDRFVLAGATVSYTDETGEVTRVENLNLQASLPDFAGPLTVDFNGDLSQVPVNGQLSLASASDFFAGSRTSGALEVSAGVNSLRFVGNLTSGGVVDGNFEAALSDPSFLPALAGLSQGLGADQIEASGGLALAPDGLALAGLDLALDQNRLRGTVDVTFADPRPRVVADLDLGDFDLSALATPADNADAQAGWSRDPIDVAFLGLVDGDIRVAADSLELGTAQLGATILDTAIEDRRSVTRIQRLVAYDGAIGGEVILNGRSGFSTRVDVAGSALAISRLLSELVGYDRLVAAGDLRLNVLGSGRSMNAVMNSLAGDGAFNVGAGELIGLDIVGMLTNLDPSFVGDTRRTIFDEITVSFRVVDGVIIYDDLTVAAPLFRATGTGQIGLGGQTLDLRMLPQLLGGERAGIAVPLTIRGTWDAPRVGLDLENMIRQGIESEVGQRLQGEAAERLGVTVDEGQSVEDAVRGRVEEELRRGLGGLLGR